MSVQDVTGINGALARIGQIQALMGVGVPTVAPPSAAGSATGVPLQAASLAPGSASGFADALAGARGLTSTAPTGAARSVAAIPGATEMAAQIDEWIARKNPDSPLKGYGAVFVREGLANGVDPRALAAIARAESSLGTDPGARSINNAFGWGPHRPFASWEDNIATVAAGLRTGYLDEGLTTLAQIQQKYCPVGAANDPMGLNSNWLRNTTTLYAELGGDPSGTVAVASTGATGTV